MTSHNNHIFIFFWQTGDIDNIELYTNKQAQKISVENQLPSLDSEYNLFTRDQHHLLLIPNTF